MLPAMDACWGHACLHRVSQRMTPDIHMRKGWVVMHHAASQLHFCMNALA